MGNMQTVETLTDRISDLPDDVLSQILSFLPTTAEAVRTSILSKRFRYQWTSINTLIFCYDHQHPIDEFVSSVDQTLSRCPKHNFKLNKFEIQLKVDLLCYPELEAKFNQWICYALDRNVQELVLGGFVISKHLFTNSSVTDLSLSFCCLKPNGQISWKRLTKLQLSWMNFGTDLIANVLEGSPCLEILMLDHCRGFAFLDIKSMSMKKLVLYVDLGSKDTVEINAPYIRSLTVKRLSSKPRIFLRDVSSLVEANLDFDPEFWVSIGEEELEEQIQGGFIERLVHVKKVTLGPKCNMRLSRLAAKGRLWRFLLQRFPRPQKGLL